MKYFDEKMTQKEAESILFNAADKNKEAFEDVKSEFFMILPAIVQRESKEYASRGADWLTSE